MSLDLPSRTDPYRLTQVINGERSYPGSAEKPKLAPQLEELQAAINNKR